MTQPSSAATSSVTGQITDEGLARLRATIGIAVPHTQPPHYLRPNADCFRHVAESYGDANPLWSDPEYAAKAERFAAITLHIFHQKHCSTHQVLMPRL